LVSKLGMSAGFMGTAKKKRIEESNWGTQCRQLLSRAP
jgi:hypothetical protein